MRAFNLQALCEAALDRIRIRRSNGTIVRLYVTRYATDIRWEGRLAGRGWAACRPLCPPPTPRRDRGDPEQNVRSVLVLARQAVLEAARSGPPAADADLAFHCPGVPTSGDALERAKRPRDFPIVLTKLS